MYIISLLFNILYAKNLDITEIKQYMGQRENIIQNELKNILECRNLHFYKAIDDLKIDSPKQDEIVKIIKQSYEKINSKSLNLYQLIPIMTKEIKCGMCEHCNSKNVCIFYLLSMFSMFIDAKLKDAMEANFYDVCLILQILNNSESMCKSEEHPECESSSNECVFNVNNFNLSGVEMREYGKNYGKKV